VPAENGRIDLETAMRLFESGGVVMIPLALCSILALAIVIERGYALRTGKVISPKIAAMLEKMNGPEDATALIAVCRHVDTEFARVVRTGLEGEHLPRAENVEALQAAARQEVGSLERGLLVLEIITGISPLLGLLGTVLGIYHVFNVIVQSGVGDATTLSGGISEALITTIVGLFIAIPSLVAHSYFTKRVDELMLEIERYGNILIHKLYGATSRDRGEAALIEAE
jgi:biopolymer transport protein ExbB